MCDSCETLRINGNLCHETGCPDAWKGVEVECKWCGAIFIPENRDQVFCNDECAENYNT